MFNLLFKKRNKILVSIILVGLMLTVLTPQVSVAKDGIFTEMSKKLAPIEDVFYGGSSDIYTTPQIIIVRIINILLGFLGVLFIILTIYGGITWMTAGGNEEQVKKARTILRQALIGLLIVISSYAIAIFIEYLYAVSTGAKSEWQYHY